MTRGGSIRRFIAAMVVALGLSFAQPALTEGQLFRVGEAQITAVDAHTRAAPDSEPPVPGPEDRVTWHVELWRAADAPDEPGLTALARGDPAAGLGPRGLETRELRELREFLELRFRAGSLLVARSPARA